ncbi:hypothetical protein DCS_01587 [Drechmeria coniospora]|uniref:Uncharacterized protein n=1 Tax=Drechmeria coniospora TaxID=98403 RepID=A0A151GTP7_DRECN|nr:hypothetical protein DCS_01587 [Drechmeria coniospora]KYK60450.1 hypothetical protein DCS_01587 [Drechmeria coniospora]
MAVYTTRPHSDTKPLILSTSTASLDTQLSTAEVTSATAVSHLVGGETRNEDRSGDRLTTGQKAGATLGSVTLAGLALGILMLIRHRRKKRRKSDSEHSKISESVQRRDTWGYHVEKDVGNGDDDWKSRPTHPNQNPTPPLPLPKAYNRSSWGPGEIGLAISPPHSSSPSHSTRRVSKLLPAKPTLAPDAPKNSHQPEHEIVKTPQQRLLRLVDPSPPNSRSKNFQPPAPPLLTIPKQEDFRKMVGISRLGRGSTVTEFEEDGGTCQSPEGQIWVLPSATPGSTVFYVADKNGNWTLGDRKKASPADDLATGRLNTGASPKATMENSVSLPTANKTRMVDEAPTRLPSEAPEVAVPTTAMTGNPTGTPPLSTEELHQTALPKPLFSTHPNPRHVSTTRRSSIQKYGRPRAASTESSVTVISTSPMIGGKWRSPEPSRVNLSPITESPRPKDGHSQITHPRTGDRDCGTMAASKPVERLLMRPILGRPVGRPSPTLGMYQSPAVPDPAAYSAVRGGSGVVENPALLRTGLPTVRIVEPSPELEDDRDRLPSVKTRVAALRASIAPERRTYRQTSTSETENRQKLHELEMCQNLKPIHPLTGVEHQPQPQPPSTPHHGLHDAPSQSPQPYLPFQPSLAAHGGHNDHFLSQSLIAKNLDSGSASQMGVPTKGQGQSTSESNGRHESIGSASLAAETMTPRQLPSGDDLAPASLWVPRLTPSRRGDDLFLNVH